MWAVGTIYGELGYQQIQALHDPAFTTPPAPAPPDDEIVSSSGRFDPFVVGAGRSVTAWLNNVPAGSELTVRWTIGGGNGDAGVAIWDPTGVLLFWQPRALTDAFIIRPTVTGSYAFVFGNEFSIFTAKTVTLMWELRE